MKERPGLLDTNNTHLPDEPKIPKISISDGKSRLPDLIHNLCFIGSAGISAAAGGFDTRFSVTERHASLAPAIVAAASPAAPRVGIVDYETRVSIHIDPVDFRSPQIWGAEMIDKDKRIPAFDAEIIHAPELIQADVVF